jgi:hypothetical protein
VPQDVDVFMPFPPRISPDASAARARAVAWARAHGLITCPADEERFTLWDIAGLMARWLPDATGTVLDQAVNVVNLITILDDQFDSPANRDPERAAQIGFDFAQLARPGGAAIPDGPLAQAYGEVRDWLYGGASPIWTQRAFIHHRWYLDACASEARNRFDRRTPERAEFSAQRRKSGYVYPMLDLSQKAYCFELPDAMYEDPVVARMAQITADVISTLNDLHSLEKEEIRGQQRDNLVHVLMHESGCSRNESIAEIVQMAESWIREFIRLEQRANDDAFTRRFIDCMRSAIRGYFDWSRATARYSQIVPAAEPAYSDMLRASASGGAESNATVV